MLLTICTSEVLVGRMKEMSMYMHHCGLYFRDYMEYNRRVVVCKSFCVHSVWALGWFPRVISI